VNKKVVAALFAVGITGALALSGCGPQTKTAKVTTGQTDAEVAFRMDMRRLWEDHVVWTRLVTLGVVDTTGGLDNATNKLVGNSGEMAALFEKYYGKVKGGRVGSLFSEHTSLTTDIVKATKAGDAPKAAEGEKKWRENADKLASRLLDLNPEWSKIDLKAMWRDHLDFTKAEFEARANKDYAGDVKAFDAVRSQALDMADVLSNGIVKQFPRDFGRK